MTANRSAESCFTMACLLSDLWLGVSVSMLQVFLEQPKLSNIRSNVKFSTPFGYLYYRATRRSFLRFGNLLQFPDFIVKLGERHLFNENHSPRGPQTRMGVVEEEVLSEAGFDDSILLHLNLLRKLGERAVVFV